MGPFRVLFACRGNDARSIMAEVLLQHWGGARFLPTSGGPAPAAACHPLTLATLEAARLPVAGLAPRNWELFAGPDAPPLQFVFLLDDLAELPAWPGSPLVLRWNVLDPLGEEDEALRPRAFRRTLRELEARLKLFANLRLEELRSAALAEHVRLLDRLGPSDEAAHEPAGPSQE